MNLGTQAQKKATLAEWIEWNGGYGVPINVAGIPIKGDITKLRYNDEMRGMGDVLCCWLGMLIYFEFKRPKNDSLREAQGEHKVRVERAGGRYYEITSVDDGILILKRISIDSR